MTNHSQEPWSYLVDALKEAREAVAYVLRGHLEADEVEIHSATLDKIDAALARATRPSQEKEER